WSISAVVSVTERLGFPREGLEALARTRSVRAAAVLERYAALPGEPGVAAVRALGTAVEDDGPAIDALLRIARDPAAPRGREGLAQGAGSSSPLAAHAVLERLLAEPDSPGVLEAASLQRARLLPLLADRLSRGRGSEREPVFVALERLHDPA